MTVQELIAEFHRRVQWHRRIEKELRELEVTLERHNRNQKIVDELKRQAGC